MKIIVYFILMQFALLLPEVNIYAQKIVQGKILDSLNKPISNANITIAKKSTATVIEYTFSGLNGDFLLNFEGNIFDTLEIKVSLYGYSANTFLYVPTNNIENINFVLYNKSINLPDVIVQNSAIFTRGDTINYQVKSFQQKHDMVIADVIRKMPGIEIMANGQIKYQGVSISKYYIEGLDLLDEKYSLANNNIPANAVDRVQILENHQPIKALDSFSFSNRAALNIKLNKDAKQKLLGRTKLGLGGMPLIADLEVVPMKFGKSQFLGSYKYTNSGNDYAGELTTLGDGPSIDELKGNTINSEYLYIPSIVVPPIKKNRYLFNNIHAISINGLTPLKKDIQLRINLDYINDNQNQNSILETNYYFIGDTIRVQEKQKNEKRINQIKSSFSIISNSAKRYLINTLKINTCWNNSNGLIHAKDSTNQTINAPFNSISNNFNLIKTKNSKVFGYVSFISLSNTPQSLMIVPSNKLIFFNDSVLYNYVNQQVTLNTAYLNNYISFGKKMRSFSLETKIGFSLLFQSYQTRIEADSNYQPFKLNDKFSNQLSGSQYNVYIFNSINYAIKKLKISLSLPLSYIETKYTEANKPIEKNFKNVLFNYSITSVYQSSSAFKVVGEFNKYDIINSPYSASDNFVLNSYRNLNKNNGLLSLLTRYQNSISLNFKDSYKMIFANVGSTIIHDTYNVLLDQTFLNEKSIGNLVEINNLSEIRRAFVTGSKYFYKIKTSFSLGLVFETKNSTVLRQSELLFPTNNSISVQSKVNTKFSKMALDVSLEYKKVASFQNNLTTRNSNILFNQIETLYYYPFEQAYFKFNFEHYYIQRSNSQSKNYYFGDIGGNYKTAKSKLEFELQWQNIFNTNSFSNISINKNVESISLYQIRPSQIVGKIHFLF